MHKGGGRQARFFTPEEVEELRFEYNTLTTDEFCYRHGISTKTAIATWGKKGKHDPALGPKPKFTRADYERKYKKEVDASLDDNTKAVVEKFGVSVNEIQLLLKKGYGFSEILAGSIINGKLRPKNLIVVSPTR